MSELKIIDFYFILFSLLFLFYFFHLFSYFGLRVRVKYDIIGDCHNVTVIVIQL